MWETVGKKHATAAYNSIPEFQSIVNLMAALAYVRQDKIVDFYNSVIEPLTEDLPESTPEPAFDCITYFERNYVGRKSGRAGCRRAPMFQPELWSIYPDLMENSPTTTNSLESFNCQWNATKLPPDNIWKVISGFRREDSLARERHLQELVEVQNPKLSPDEGRRRKIAARAKMQKLKNIAEQIEDMTPEEYLTSISSIVRKN